MSPKQVIVNLGERSYPIFIGPNLLEDEQFLCPYIRSSQVCIVTNSTIAPIYLDRLLALLGAYSVDVVELPDGEKYKNLETLNLIFDGLLSNKHNRHTTIIALGGGVVGDMAGFASASYQRGVRFIQIPTTLLSQVDSSVGGKTGVNHSLGKNMIGAFHQPQSVIIDTQVLKTLPKRELSAGLAEVIKYGFIADYDFFIWLEENINKLMQQDGDALSYAIERSCRIKANVVSQDENESGVRAILNLGHTFGHAIESHEGYGNWLHGEAVGAGMVMACELSCRMGLISFEFFQRAVALIAAAELPIAAPAHMQAADFMRYMQVDKKVLDGCLRLIILSEPGQAIVSDEIPDDLLQATLDDSNQLESLALK